MVMMGDGSTRRVLESLSAWLAAAAMAAQVGAPGCAGDSPAEPCAPVIPYRSNLLPEPPVDLLLVIDDASTMEEEQAALVEQLPFMVRALATGDRDDDGVVDFPPVDSLHVGVVSPGMGTGGFAVPGCAGPDFGEDGLLRTTGSTSAPGCLEVYPRFLSYGRWSGDDPDAFARDLGCVARIGTGGCAFGQPLEAALKAVTPSAGLITFAVGTSGHGDGANRGFLRSGSLFGVIVVTNRDDCSALDPELFDPASAVYAGEPAVRCAAHAEALHAIERYVDGLLAVAWNPESLLYVVIAGVPPSLVEDPHTVDYAAVLADPGMQVEVDPTDPTRLRPSCDAPDRGPASPPRRLVEVARELEARRGDTLVTSVCQSDLHRPVQAVLERIAWFLGAQCFRSRLARDDRGLVDCDLLEILPVEGEHVRCDQVPGRVRIGERPGSAGVAHELCRVEQLPTADGAVSAGSGWYYDDFSVAARHSCGSRGSRVYTAGARPAIGTELWLECAPSARRDVLSVGSACPLGAAGCAAGEEIGGRTCEYALTCDSRTRTLQMRCTTDDDCPFYWHCGPSSLCTTETCRR